MSIKKSAVLFGVALSMAAFMSACSSDTKEGGSSADVAKVDESKCRVCHATTIDPVTTDNILTDYLNSAHNLVPDARSSYPEGVGCQGCHGGGGMHNGVGPMPYPDPDTAGKCFECHKNYLSAAHFKAYTTNAGSRPAMYASKNYQTDCTACHDPHKADKAIGQEHKDWAESGHGDVNGLAWSDRDFKNYSNGACARCHTATGYINYVESGFTAPTASWATAGDFTREVATCKVCHTSYNFKNSIRAVPAVTAAYKENFETTNVDFPDCGPSNLCITCHAGRESGQTIRDADITTFTNKSFVNPHYLAAAATLFAKGGYHYYPERDSASQIKTYDNYSTGNGFSHGRIGMEGRISRPAPGTGSAGPCVACHLGASAAGNSRSHTFDPINAAAAGVCNGCHGGQDLAALIEEEKVLVDRMMDYFEFTLGQNGIFYDPNNHPYFVKSAGASAATATNQLKNWVYSSTNLIGPATGNPKDTMGAAFNFKILKAEKGSHVHNRTYERRLVFDAIQYLQTGTVTYSNRDVPATGTVNDQLSFTSYSAAVHAGAPGVLSRTANPIQINYIDDDHPGLKNYLQRFTSSKYFRR